MSASVFVCHAFMRGPFCPKGTGMRTQGPSFVWIREVIYALMRVIDVAPALDGVVPGWLAA